MLEIEFKMNVPRNEIRLASNGIEFYEYQGSTAIANNNKTTRLNSAHTRITHSISKWMTGVWIEFLDRLQFEGNANHLSSNDRTF